MGRYLNFRSEIGDWGVETNVRTYTHNNHLLTSILNAFGQEDQTFNTDEVSGGLAGLT
jgi:hypothetical protein